MANDFSEFKAPRGPTAQEPPPSESASVPPSNGEGIFSWYHEINSQQWKAFIAAFLGWTLDAMDLLIFAFAVTIAVFGLTVLDLTWTPYVAYRQPLNTLYKR